MQNHSLWVLARRTEAGWGVIRGTRVETEVSGIRASAGGQLPPGQSPGGQAVVIDSFLSPTQSHRVETS